LDTIEHAVTDPVRDAFHDRASAGALGIRPTTTG
jgi:hypothetical protein